MPKQKLKPFDYAFAKMMQEKMGVKFVDSKGKPIEFEKAEQKESASVHNKIEFPEYNDGLLEEFDKQFFENGQDDDLTETAPEQKDVK